MAKGTDKRRDALREHLVTIAEAQVRASGLASLRARALAAQAGCAVGAIYNVFDDMTGLALAVNGRTFHRLGGFVAHVADTRNDAGPTDRMVTIAVASGSGGLWVCAWMSTASSTGLRSRNTFQIAGTCRALGGTSKL